MQGWNLKNGDIIKENLSIEDFFAIISSFVLSSKGKTTSYKYAFFKSIIDNIFNCNQLILKFEYLYETFGRIYWNIIVKYKLPQIRKTSRWQYSQVEIIIKEILEKYPFLQNLDFDSLCDEYKKEYMKYVPYILEKYVIGALYADLEGAIYGFDKKKKIMWFTKDSILFLKNNKVLLEKINYYAWISWMEEIFDNNKIVAYNIASKIDEVTKRENLEKFKKSLLLLGENKCFYCEKNIKNIHVDHFIPWSFVKNDQLWNMVISCSACNLKKNNKIPSEKYFKKIFNRNKEYFNNTYEKELMSMYNSAIHNGFLLWEKDD